MASALDASAYIYEGVWINWTKGGRVFGTTLTVNPVHASVLSPALALIISIAGSQLWRLFQFALHQTRATHKEKNFLYHQQQVTLRNTATDLNTLWRLLRVAFAWRHYPDVRVLWESLPLILWTSAHLILIVLAGLFSSWLLHASDDVLSRSPWCGQFKESYLDMVYSPDITDPNKVSARFEFTRWRNSRYVAIQQHVDICNTALDGCDTLPTDRLPWDSNLVDGGCPLDSSICHPNADSIVFDTGYLSSALHFGFNARNSDRISFRMRSECAPLDDSKHVTGWQNITATSSYPPHQASDAYYGPGGGVPRNATFSFTKQYKECEERKITVPYILNAEFTPPSGVDGVNSTFNPIPELQEVDKDVSLVMLMTNNDYRSPVVDPWFSAQLAYNDTNAFCLGAESTVYTREIPVTTIGCTQQWQICNTDSLAKVNSSGCSPLLDLNHFYNLFNKPSEEIKSLFNPRQLATASRIITASLGATYYLAVAILTQTNTPPLKARELVYSTQGPALPENQWQIETSYWTEILLAYLQQTALDYGTGQFSPRIDHIKLSTTGPDHALCQNQIIHSTTYRNFNFFALLLCVIICTIITILGLCIEDVIGYIRHKLEYSGHDCKTSMWIINSDLEMLRTASQLKLGTHWSTSRFGIPLAEANSKANVDDLKSDVLEVEPGRGIVNSNVKWKQNAVTIAMGLDKRRTHGRGFYKSHKPHKGCATCRSFNILPADRSESVDGTIAVNTTTRNISDDQTFTFTSDVSTQVQMAQVHSPLLPNEATSTEQVTNDSPDAQQHEGPQHSTRRKHGYDIINPNLPPLNVNPTYQRIENNGRLFQYTHDVPPSLPTKPTARPSPATRILYQSHAAPLLSYEERAKRRNAILSNT